MHRGHNILFSPHIDVDAGRILFSYMWAPSHSVPNKAGEFATGFYTTIRSGLHISEDRPGLVD